MSERVPRVVGVVATDGRTLPIESITVNSNGDFLVVVRASQSGPWALRTASDHLVAEAVSACDGNRTKAAKLLGIHVRTLRRKLNGGMR